jgi:hypothetical protein
LTCAARVNFYQLSTSLFRFVRKFCDEGRPSGIRYRLRQHPASKTFDVQIFYSYQTVLINESARQFMMKVCALVSNVNVNTREKLHGLMTAMRAFLSPRYLAACAPQLRLRFSVVVRIFNLRSVTQSGKRGESYIYADTFRAWLQRRGFAFNAKANVPSPTLTLDRNRLYLSFDGAMQFDLNKSDALQPEFARVKQAASVAIFRICKAVVSLERFKAREAATPTCFRSSKEVFKRTVCAPQRILSNAIINNRGVTGSANLFKLRDLRIMRDGFSVKTPCVAPLLECGVIQAASFAKLAVQKVNLRASRIEPVFESFAYHFN